ncbi:Pescadillo like protein [Nosema granulosis]|uniref:Pescadillo like protein n=1 Tax=Nosema granulosis TaxID=83296 RepID=A0A9P6GXS2_9MICR|nr:Pescadillo like protein [Nosema granulosis]
MVQKYLKPVKKFASKKLIMEKLSLTPKEFDLLAALTGITPFVPKRKEKYDQTDDFFYKITDYERIKHSHVLKTLKYNKKRLKKKEDFIENRLYDKASQIREREFKYVDLVKDRYKSLPKAVDDLGNSLTALCLGKRLEMDDLKILEEFKKFCVEKGLLRYGFMSTKGIYYEINVEKMRVIWLHPYPNVSLQEIIEIKKDEPKPFKWSKLNFLHFASDSEDLEEDVFEPVNDPTKLDVSLLSYSLPFQKYHLELVLYKLRLLYTDKESNKRKDFEGLKFYIENENLYEDLSFVIKSLSGEITKENDFDFCVGEKIDNYLEEKIYLHPQYIFDVLNSLAVDLSYENYRVGKNIPKHKSPFVLKNFVNPDILSTLSKTKRNRLQDIVDGFEDVHYSGE